MTKDHHLTKRGNHWWNKFLAFERGDRRRVYFDEQEVAAFHWELARRNFPLADYPCYIELNRGERDIAYIALSRKFARWNPPVVVHQAGRQIDYPDFVNFPALYWNLRASNHSLQKQFLEMVESARKQNGICRTRRNANNSARTKGGDGQPWRWIELLDLDLSCQPQRLNSNERSHKSQAKMKRDSLQQVFLEVWKEIENHRRLMPELEKSSPSASKIMRERAKW